MLKKHKQRNKETSQIYSGRSQDLQEISAYVYISSLYTNWAEIQNQLRIHLNIYL